MTRYGKIDPNDANRVIYAANGGVYEGRLYPTFPDAVQRALGNLPVAPDTPPSEPAPEGYHWEPRGWEISGLGSSSQGLGSRVSGLGEDDASAPETRSPNPETRIKRVYELVADPPPPPRRWTPLAIKRACGDKWPTLRAALTDAGLYEDFIMAQELVEDDDAFQRGYTWAVAQYWQEAVENILSAALTANC